jgi:hypothetical protein
MERIKPLALVSILAAPLLLGACGKSPAPSTTANASNESANSVEPVFSAVNMEIQTGKFDDAAAKLMALRVSGHQFNDKEASAYRDAMNAAYSAAVAAAAKGDPRGKAAMEMLRASGNH